MDLGSQRSSMASEKTRRDIPCAHYDRSLREVGPLLPPKVTKQFPLVPFSKIEVESTNGCAFATVRAKCRSEHSRRDRQRARSPSLAGGLAQHGRGSSPPGRILA